jgi:hypothetical protein
VGPDDPGWAALRALTASGLRVDLVAAAEADRAALAGVAASLGGGLAALESTGDAGQLASAVADQPALRRVPLLGPGAGVDLRTARVDLAGRCPGCDRSTGAALRGSPDPSRSTGAPLRGSPDPSGPGTDGARGAAPGRARLQVTEATLGAGVPESVAARYLPRVLLGRAATAARTYLGALDGDGRGPLLRADGSPARAHRVLANLVALLADPRPPPTPGALAYRLSGDTDGLRHLLLHKADGHFWLALWVERPSWDPATGQELSLPAQPVRVTLARKVAAARAFVPELGTVAERHFAGPTRTIEVEVPDRVLLVELLPLRPPAAVRSTAVAAPPPPARAPRPRAAAGGGDRPAPAPTDGPALAARPPASAAPARRGHQPLAFTGSAALSLLVASALLLLVGVTALAASRRRWHHHR